MFNKKRSKEKSKLQLRKGFSPIKIIIPIALVLIVAVVAIAVTSNKAEPPKEVIEEKIVAEEGEIVEEEVTEEKRKVLTYKTDGVKLYDHEEKELDSLDFKDDSIENKEAEISEIDKQLTNAREKFNESDRDEGLRNNVKDLENRLAKAIEEKETLIANQKTMEKVKTTNENAAFIRSKDELLIVRVVGDELIHNTLNVEDTSLIHAIYVDEKDTYVAFKDKVLVYKNDAGETQVEEIDVLHDINNMIVLDGDIYYSANKKVYRIDGESLEVHSIDLGANTESLFIQGDNIYAINDFGEGEDNSILVKMKKDSLYIENILELKGKRSKFVSINDNILQVEQMDAVKTIDLNNQEPLNSYRKITPKTNGFVMEGALYELIDNDLSKTNMKSVEKEPSKINELHGFVIIPGR